MVLFLQMELPSVPVFLSVNGLYDVEYRIVTSCRNGCVYTLKRYRMGTLWCLSMLKCLCGGFHNRTKKGLLHQVEDYYFSKGHCQPAIVNSRNKTRATVNQLINQYLHCHISGEKLHTHEMRHSDESSDKSHASIHSNINRLKVYV